MRPAEQISAKSPLYVWSATMSFRPSNLVDRSHEPLRDLQEGTDVSSRTAATRKNVSAGILGYRRRRYGLEMLLVHPGGSYWRNRDDGVWSIPKGEIAPVAGDGTRPMAA
jgi:hypothetical protein